jgi:hypothetical protein
MSGATGATVQDRTGVARAIGTTPGDFGRSSVIERASNRTPDDDHSTQPFAIHRREREQTALRRAMMPVEIADEILCLPQRAGNDA